MLHWQGQSFNRSSTFFQVLLDHAFKLLLKDESFKLTLLTLSL